MPMANYKDNPPGREKRTEERPQYGRRMIPRYKWLPPLMLVYLLGMTAWFGVDLIRAGEIARLVTVFVVDLIVIALLYIFLKKRYKNR